MAESPLGPYIEEATGLPPELYIRKARHDLYRALDRLANQAWRTLPRSLDRARKYRNLYDNAVK